TSLGTAVSVSLMLLLALIFELKEFNWQIEYGIAFGISAFNFLLGFIGVLFLKETRITDRKIVPPKMFVALKDKTFLQFFIINSFFGLVIATLWPIFPIAQINVLDLQFSQIAIISAIFSTCSSLTNFFGGKIGDRFGRKPLLIIGRMAMFTIPVITIVAILMDNWLWLILSNIIGGSGVGLVTVAQNAYVLDIAPEDQMGAYSGLTQVGWGIATFIGSLSFGFFADALEITYGTRSMVLILFTVIAVTRFIASTGYFLIEESLDKEPEEEEKIGEIEEEAYISTFEDSQTRTK
ncbi:MAG: MFS transporter, partial [Asgard group archaeon]|nr:MFS transporter [Asgard group archaeon]